MQEQALMGSPFGPLRVAWARDRVTGIDLAPRPDRFGDDAAGPPAWLADEFMAYFADGFHRISLSPVLTGTNFQLRVWAAIQHIPPGTTRTYCEIAEELGSGPRAVGGACRANPCPIVVPCHRIVSERGLGGFSGDRSGRLLEIKRWLLRHEGVPTQ